MAMGIQSKSFQTPGFVDVTATLTTIVTAIPGTFFRTLCAEIENLTALKNLTVFVLQLQDYEGGEWYNYLSAADWADAGNLNRLYVEEDPSSLVTGHISHIHVRINNAYGVRLQANCTAAEATKVRIHGTFGGA